MSTSFEQPDRLASGSGTELIELRNDIPILLVDDRQVNLRVLEKLLQGKGYVFVLASSGKEALDFTLKQDFALIVLDVNMPEMDGHETAKLIHSNPKSKDVPIIFVTASEDAETRIKSYTAGAVDHLSKPVQPLVLRSKVETFAKLYRQRRLIEENNKESRQKDLLLLQQDKLASIGKLAAGIAHEINNPLGFIMSNLGTLNNYIEVIRQYLFAQEEVLKSCCPEEQLKQLADLRMLLDLPFILEEDLTALISESIDGAERVKRIVLNLKDFARTDESGMKATDLNLCVQSAANIVCNEIKYVADLDLTLGRLPPVICNPQQINLVITNLLINACHAMKDYGRISVTTSYERDKIVLSVADTGTGIPPEVIGSIFDPFFTTKPVGQGTGLGLSTSYDIIKKHNGEITVVSEPGVGTTFTILLPLWRSKEPPE